MDYKYSLQPLSATGSLVLGGRFNIGNHLDPSKFPAFAALYVAENYDTAYEERFGLVPSPGAGIEGHEFALRQPGSFTSVNVTGHVSNLFDLRSATNLKKFVKVISGFEIPKELKELARSLGISGRLLADTGNLLRKTLLAHDWRMYPNQYEIPANPQVFGRLLLDAGFASFLYGVGTTDPLSLADATALLLGAGLLAAYVPARRASRIDPTVVLREA